MLAAACCGIANAQNEWEEMDKRQEALLLALKPFLRKERQEKIDRALHAARLASLASLALKNRGRGPGAKETP